MATVWGIADLHLSFARPDRRERYAARWRDHADKIEAEWRTVVQRDDLILIPGDISMAANHRDLQPDLTWIDRLPGTKVLSPGNHDRWWNKVEAIRPMLRRSMRAVQGDALKANGVVICGVRGAAVVRDESTDADRKAEETEVAALTNALEAAHALRESSEPLVVLWHYPPFDQRMRPSKCVELLESNRVTACVYGHLHAESQWSTAVQGVVGTVRYHCVASDAIGFRPLKLMSL